MGRLSSFVSKAGDIAKEVNQEYQTLRQEQQQRQTQRPASTYSQQGQQGQRYRPSLPPPWPGHVQQGQSQSPSQGTGGSYAGGSYQQQPQHVASPPPPPYQVPAQTGNSYTSNTSSNLHPSNTTSPPGLGVSSPPHPTASPTPSATSPPTPYDPSRIQSLQNHYNAQYAAAISSSSDLKAQYEEQLRLAKEQAARLQRDHEERMASAKREEERLRKLFEEQMTLAETAKAEELEKVRRLQDEGKRMREALYQTATPVEAPGQAPTSTSPAAPAAMTSPSYTPQSQQGSPYFPPPPTSSASSPITRRPVAPPPVSTPSTDSYAPEPVNNAVSYADHPHAHMYPEYAGTKSVAIHPEFGPYGGASAVSSPPVPAATYPASTVSSPAASTTYPASNYASPPAALSPEAVPPTTYPTSSYASPPVASSAWTGAVKDPWGTPITANLSTHPCGINPISECVTSNVNFPLDRFTHASAPGFVACSRCYVDHIWNSPFRHEFKLDNNLGEGVWMCDFGSTRMKDSLFPAAVATGSLNDAIEYMKVRGTVENCQESAALKDKYWYTTSDIPGLTVCEACYQDQLMASSFASRFQFQRSAGAQSCAFGMQYVKRMYKKHTKTNDWTAFVSEVKTRLTFPACPRYEVVKGNARTWFSSKRGPQGFTICLACYCDYVFDSPNAKLFEQTNVPRTSRMRCISGHLNVLFPMQEAVTKEDWNMLWRAIDAVDSHQHCEPKGTKGTTWFTLPNNPSDFAVCAGCVAGIAEPLGGGSFFIPKPGTSKQDLRVCCFNIGHPRFTEYLMKFSECLYRKDWNPLGSFAADFADVQPCPKWTAAKGKGKRYWGWADCVQICHECYMTFAKGTSLEPQFELLGQLILEETPCDMYSSRMRRLYKEACAANNLPSLLSFARERRLIYSQTVPQCERLLAQQKMAASQAKMMGVAGTALTAMGGAQDVSCGRMYAVGWSGIGYAVPNPMTLQGAAYNQQMVGLTAQAMDPGLIAQVKELEARWKTVE